MAYHATRGPVPGRTTGRHFVFCTGIENSYPVITDKSGKSLRRDGLSLSHHYDRWREDFELVRGLGLRFLRYGPPLYRCHLGPMRYDWSFPDETFAALQKLGIEPIADLCHFGVPDFVGDFQNPDFPVLLAEYAGAFARRYRWVRLYTPVNEIFVAARFSGELGWWNERLRSDRGFVTALKHLAKANVLAAEAILKVRPDALFVQSESSEYFHASTPGTQARADFLNQRRFLSLDLCFGTDVAATQYEYLMDNGMTRDEYRFFLERGRALRPYCIMGNDYYITNEHEVVEPGDEVHPSGEIFGYYVITHQYFERYRLPVMHTETNRKNDEEAPAWLLKQWANVVRLKRDGVPILGFTWYSLLDQTDWDTALREDNHRVNPMGLFDLNRRERKVGKAYRELIRRWHDELPAQSMSRDLAVPRDDVVGEPRPGGPEEFDRALRHTLPEVYGMSRGQRKVGAARGGVDGGNGSGRGEGGGKQGERQPGNHDRGGRGKTKAGESVGAAGRGKRQKR